MIKLKDILAITGSDVTIMHRTFPAVTFSRNRYAAQYFSTDFLDREVKKIDTYNDRIRIWLKEEEEMNNNE